MMLTRPIFPMALTAFLIFAVPHADSAERLSDSRLQGDALSSAADTMLRDIDQATWIRDGQSKRVMYVFFDPNCPYCRKVHDNLRVQVEFGEVELRWIPVGILMTTSLGKAAALLEAKDPAAALQLNEQRFTTESGGFGGISEEPAPRPDTLARLDRNLELLRRSGRNAVPSLLFRDRFGKANFIVGAPQQAALEVIVQNLE